MQISAVGHFKSRQVGSQNYLGTNQNWASNAQCKYQPEKFVCYIFKKMHTYIILIKGVSVIHFFVSFRDGIQSCREIHHYNLSEAQCARSDLRGHLPVGPAIAVLQLHVGFLMDSVQIFMETIQ